MTDMIAYVGDQLSFYMDYKTNESFLDSAIEARNVIRLAKQMGYKHPGAAAASGVVSLYILVPAKALGLVQYPLYMPVLERGSIFTSTSGAMLRRTEWTTPTNSSDTPKSDRNEMVVYPEGTLVSSKFTRAVCCGIDYFFNEFGKVCFFKYC